jgi:hypothetical protein
MRRILSPEPSRTADFSDILRIAAFSDGDSGGNHLAFAETPSLFHTRNPFATCGCSRGSIRLHLAGTLPGTSTPVRNT